MQRKSYIPIDVYDAETGERINRRIVIKPRHKHPERCLIRLNKKEQARVENFYIVVDTNVMYAGLRSQKGASYQLLIRLNDPRWQVNLSVALVLEYEEILTRHQVELNLTPQEINDLIDGWCAIAQLHGIFY